MVILEGSCLVPSYLVEANLLHGSQHERGQERGGGGGGRHCSNHFCIHPHYEKLELPPPNNGTTVQVVITPHILEIFEVGGQLCNL